MFSLILPALGLVVLAIAIPRLIERFVPETLTGVLVGGVVSALLVWLASAGLFAWLYHLQGPQVWTVFQLAPGAGLRHFLTLGAQAALVWAPILILVVGTSPRRWKEAVW